MASVNKVILVGNLERDPELGQTEAGEAFVALSVVTLERWQGRDGQEQARTDAHRVEVMGRDVDSAKRLTAHRLVYVEGKIREEEFKDPDGNRRWKTSIRVGGFGTRIVPLPVSADVQQTGEALPINKVFLVGNVGRVDEPRYTQSGDPIAQFSLATSERRTDRQGHKEERTDWHRVEVFGAQAKVVRDFVTKGRSLFVEGSIRYDEWTDRDQQKRTTTKIRVSGPVSGITLLGSRGDGGGRGDRQETAADRGEGADFQPSDEDVPF